MNNSNSKTTSSVKMRCPNCFNFTYAHISSKGTIIGKCSHCKATFVKRQFEKETSIKIVANS
ncbi:MAG: hypothetical protein SO434_03315 [Eubacteriales bacterium]|nr:hypothetical protein [Eubacteriales bacterium]